MVCHVKTLLLIEAQQRLGSVPRGGMAKGVEPTGSARLGSGHQQVQRVVYELRRHHGEAAPANR
jgi:hypothetical protein